AFVFGSAFGRHFSVGLPCEGIVVPNFYIELIFRSVVVSTKVSRIPQEAFGLPYFGVLKLFFKSLGICCRFKGFNSDHGRSLMMAMSCTGIGRKSSDDHIRFKLSNDPNGISQY